MGFCCDQIVNVEVVLAEGRIVNANKDENSDLWRALKGASAGNFGVATRFDIKTLPYDGLWAGMLVSEASPENTKLHVATMKRFADDSEKFPDSSYIVLWNYVRDFSSPFGLSLESSDIWIMSYCSRGIHFWQMLTRICHRSPPHSRTLTSPASQPIRKGLKNHQNWSNFSPFRPSSRI